MAPFLSLFLLLSLPSLLLSSPSWTYGVGTNLYPSKISIRVFPIGFPSSSDCFVSRCQEDVSITRPVDDLYGECSSNVQSGPITSLSLYSASINFAPLSVAVNSKFCQQDLQKAFDDPVFQAYSSSMNSLLEINWIEGLSNAAVDNYTCGCDTSGQSVTRLNILTSHFCNSSCSTTIPEHFPTPSPTPTPTPFPTPTPTPTPISTPTPPPTPAFGVCPTPFQTQICLERTVFNASLCAGLDDCSCLTKMVDEGVFPCDTASLCFCNQYIYFPPLPFCQGCQECQTFQWPQDCEEIQQSPSSKLGSTSLLWAVFAVIVALNWE